MAYEQKPGQGSLFRNHNKESDKHPDYTGSWTNADGEKCNIAAWIKTAKSGRKFMSLNIDSQPYNQDTPTQDNQEAFSDDVPF